MNQNTLSKDALLNIGKVVSVRGRNVEVLVSKAKNSAILLYEGEIIRNVSVGGYVKIAKGFNELIGKIDGEFVTEDKTYDYKAYKIERDRIKRVLSISLIGYLEGRNFKQGVKDLPLLDNECFLLVQDELDSVHNFIKTINGVPDIKLRIGVLANDVGKEVEVGINSLFASHIGIFGNTGSGKSYTLASLYHKLLKKFQSKPGFKRNARFVIIDFNGEYISEHEKDNIITSSTYKNIYNLTTRKNTAKKYPISESEINDDDFWAIFLTATEKTQKPFLRRALSNKFYSDRFDTKKNFKGIILSVLDSLIIRKTEKSDIIQFLNELKHALGDKIDLDGTISTLQGELHWHSVQSKYYYENGSKVFQDQSEFSKSTNEAVGAAEISTKDVTYLEKIRLKIIFQYYNELAKFDLNTEHISPLIKRLKKIEDLDKVINVTDTDSEKVLDVISLTNLNT